MIPLLAVARPTQLREENDNTNKRYLYIIRLLASILFSCCISVNKVITIITPLMRKVHQHISRSGDLVSISISPNINRLGIRLVTLSTHCALGTLPLGLLIIQQSGEVPGQKSNVLAETLHEFRSHLPEDVFYGE